MDEILKRIEEIKEWISNNRVLPDFQNNNDYMDFAVELGNHVRYLMMVGTSLLPSTQTQGYTKENAVIIGLFVRMYKLYDAVCFHVLENQGEIAEIFNRLIFEAHVKMLYLMKFGAKSINNFIFVSYQGIKESYEDLLAKKDQRDLIPIERRILSKYEAQLDDDNIDKNILFANRNWKLDGKSFRDLLKDLNSEHSYAFSAQSSLVHGDWKDIRANHLIEGNGFFHPNLEHDHVDPSYICPISILCLDTLIEFLNWNQSDEDEYLIGTVESLREIIYKVDSHHEINVTSKYKII